MDMIHGGYQKWCRLCIVREQLKHARTMAAQVEKLEAELDQLMANPL